MLISDKFVFIELQKTGGSQVKKLLLEVAGGKEDFKYPVPPDDLLKSGKQFIGTIRDPWGWYLALWLFGCQKKGDLYQRLTNEKKWERVLAKAGAGEDDAAAKAKPAAGSDEDGDADEKEKKTLPANWGPDRAKSFWYADEQNVEAFREWLQAVLGSPRLRRLLETGYGKSPISKAGGLMTFRYFSLYAKGTEDVDKSVDTMPALKEFDKTNGFVQHFVRAEAQGADVLKALESIGVPLTDKQRKSIEELRRPGGGAAGPDTFYDEASTRLVMRRDKFLIDKFSYKHKKP